MGNSFTGRTDVGRGRSRVTPAASSCDTRPSSLAPVAVAHFLSVTISTFTQMRAHSGGDLLQHSHTEACSQKMLRDPKAATMKHRERRPTERSGSERQKKRKKKKKKREQEEEEWVRNWEKREKIRCNAEKEEKTRRKRQMEDLSRLN